MQLWNHIHIHRHLLQAFFRWKKKTYIPGMCYHISDFDISSLKSKSNNGITATPFSLFRKVERKKMLTAIEQMDKLKLEKQNRFYIPAHSLGLLGGSLGRPTRGQCVRKTTRQHCPFLFPAIHNTWTRVLRLAMKTLVALIIALTI